MTIKDKFIEEISRQISKFHNDPKAIKRFNESGWLDKASIEIQKKMEAERAAAAKAMADPTIYIGV